MKDTAKLIGLTMLVPVVLGLALVMHLQALKYQLAALEWLGWK